MPKELKELRRFLNGIVSQPSAADIPDESPIMSQNLESSDEEGKLKGAREEEILKDGIQDVRVQLLQPTSTLVSGDVNPVTYTFSMFDDTQSYTNDAAVTTQFQNKFVFDQIAGQIQLSKYVETAKSLPALYSGGETQNGVPSFYDTAINTTVGFAAADTIITVENISNNNTIDGQTWAEAGRKIKIESEEMLIIDVDFTANTIEVIRGVNDTSAVDHNAVSSYDVHAEGDYFGIAVTFKSGITVPPNGYVSSLVRTQPNGNPSTQTWFENDITSYLEIGGRNFSLISSRDDESNFTKTNLVTYHKDTSLDPPEYQLKVIKNFYEEGDSPRNVVIPQNPNVNSNSSGYPEYVSMAKGPNAVYIGTGSSVNSAPQWLGEIHHERFGQKYEGYHLEPAELKAIDDGQSVFAINTLEYPVLGSATAGGTYGTRSQDWLLCTSDSSRNFFTTKNTDDAPAGDSYGKQFKGEGIGFIPSVVSCSPEVMKEMSNSSNNTAGGHYPWTALAWDTAGTTAIGGHDDSTTYVWTADASTNNKLYLYAVRQYNPGTNAGAIQTVEQYLGAVNLTFNIIVDNGKMNTHLTDGTKVSRKPKAGSYISDIYEKDATIYIQMSHQSGFTFDEEYLYCINISDFDDTLWMDGQTVNAKPITPPITKVKNWGKDYRNKGHDWWMPTDCFDGGGIDSKSWIGQDGIYGSYSNYIRWRNTDMLGFLSNKKHSQYDRFLDGVQTTPDTSSNWKKWYSAKIDTLSDDEEMSAWGYKVTKNLDTNTYTSTRQDSNPKVYYSSGPQTQILGKHFGFEDYVFYPHPRGLFAYADREDIACIGYLEGKQFMSQHEMNHSRKSGNSGLFTWWRKHVVYNNTEPELYNWESYVVFNANKESYGISQRCFPYDGTMYRFKQTTETVEDEDGDYTETSNLSSTLSKEDSFRGINGLSNSNMTYEVATESTDDYSEFKTQKSAFRYGTFANTNTNSSNFEPSSVKHKSINNHLYQLEQAATSQSGQSDNNYTAMVPSKLNDILSIGRNYDKTKAKNLIITSKQEGRPQYHSYITRWEAKPLDDTYANREPVRGRGWTAVADFNPLQINNMGNGVTQSIFGADNKYQIVISPTTGDFLTGFMKYRDPGYFGSGNHTYETPAQSDDEYDALRPYFFSHPQGALDFGLNISFTDKITEQTDTDGDGVADTYVAGNFMANTTYYWKLSILYDGYQEGPLSTFEFSKKTDGFNYNSVLLSLKLSDPPKRASHIVIYRKNSPQDFYRMVKEVTLAKGWAENSADDTHTKIFVDEGRLGATYEAITGMPELMYETIVNYKLSTLALGSLVVADCYHPEIKQGQNFMFKSQPNAYSNFHWARDYCVLPTKPTNIQWWAGKIYAFDLNNMYKVNLDNLVLEDSYEGIGCIGPDTCITTDIGMFFCDYQGMYWHNGQKAENISRDIVTSSFAGDNSGVLENSASTDLRYRYHNWQNIKHDVPPKICYDPQTQSVYFIFKDRHADGSTFEGAWVYQITRKRWDMIELPIGTTEGTFTGNRNDIYVTSQDRMMFVAKDRNSRKPYDFVSKKFDLQRSTQDKSFQSVQVICNNEQDATNLATNTSTYGVVSFTLDGATLTNFSAKADGNKVKYKFKGSAKKAKTLQFSINACAVEIDSIGIVYRAKTVK